MLPKDVHFILVPQSDNLVASPAFQQTLEPVMRERPFLPLLASLHCAPVDLHQRTLARLSNTPLQAVFEKTVRQVARILSKVPDGTVFCAGRFRAEMTLEYLPFSALLLFNLFVREGVLKRADAAFVAKHRKGKTNALHLLDRKLVDALVAAIKSAAVVGAPASQSSTSARSSGQSTPNSSQPMAASSAAVVAAAPQQPLNVQPLHTTTTASYDKQQQQQPPHTTTTAPHNAQQQIQPPQPPHLQHPYNMMVPPPAHQCPYPPPPHGYPYGMMPAPPHPSYPILPYVPIPPQHYPQQIHPQPPPSTTTNAVSIPPSPPPTVSSPQQIDPKERLRMEKRTEFVRKLIAFAAAQEAKGEDDNGDGMDVDDVDADGAAPNGASAIILDLAQFGGDSKMTFQDRLAAFMARHYADSPAPVYTCIPETHSTTFLDSIIMEDGNGENGADVPSNPTEDVSRNCYRARVQLMDDQVLESGKAHPSEHEAREDVARMACEFMQTYWESALQTERIDADGVLDGFLQEGNNGSDAKKIVASNGTEEPEETGELDYDDAVPTMMTTSEPTTNSGTDAVTLLADYLQKARAAAPDYQCSMTNTFQKRHRAILTLRDETLGTSRSFAGHRSWPQRTQARMECATLALQPLCDKVERYLNENRDLAVSWAVLCDRVEGGTEQRPLFDALAFRLSDDFLDRDTKTSDASAVAADDLVR